MKKNGMRPVPPGEILNEEFLKPLVERDLGSNLDFCTWEAFALREIGYGAAVENLVPERFLSRYLPRQRIIGERFGHLDEALVRRHRREIRVMIETEPKIRKWFLDLDTRLST